MTMQAKDESRKNLAKRAFEAGLEFRGAATRWDRENRVDYHAVAKRMGELGFYGLCMPKEFGGQGGDATDYVIAVSNVFRGAQYWVPGEPIFATSGPGPSMLLLSDHDEIRRKYLPSLITGTKGCAIALTEHEHGSDLTHLETSAMLDGDEYVINGAKQFITGATENELYAVFVRFDGIPGARGVGAVIVEAGTPGFTTTPGLEFFGVRALPHGECFFKNVRIPKENLITGPGQFARLMTAFNIERLHNAAFNLGIMEAAFEEASAFVQKRVVFGRPVIEFQAVYHTLADMWTGIEAHRALTFRAAETAIDGLFPNALDVTVAKLHGAVMAQQVGLKAMELHGAHGTTTDSPMQRIFRDIITTVAAGGAPAVLRNTIASQIFPEHKFPQTRPR